MVIAFLTLGCKLNYAETSTYERGFLAAGLEVVPWQEKADVYLVNTCTVTGTSDAKSRNLVRKVHRVNPGALIVVTGCSAELHRAEFEAIEGVTRVFGAHEKSLVVPETLTLLGLSSGGTIPENASLRSAPPIACNGSPPLMLPRVAQFSGAVPPEIRPRSVRVSGTTRAFSCAPKTRTTPSMASNSAL